MAITRQKKEEILKELIQKMGDAKSISFGQYAGLSVSDMQEMRRKMREAGVEFKVAKKTLMRLAAKEQGLELPDEILEGTVGAVFSYEDAVSGPKLFKDTAKTFDFMKLLGGIMEGKVLSVAEMSELASLPSREELLAKFVGMMRSPLQNFYGAISSPMATFARTMQAYADQMPAEEVPVEEAPAPAPEPEAKAEPEVEETPAEEAPTEEPAAEAEEAETPEETPETTEESEVPEEGSDSE